MSEKNATKEPKEPLKVEEDARRREPVRAGKFRISMELIDEASENPAACSFLTLVFSRCIIFRAEAVYYGKYIEYQAFAAEFDVLEEGNELPLYDWSVTVEDGQVSQVEVSRL